MGRLLVALLFATGVYFGFYRELVTEDFEDIVQQVTMAAGELLEGQYGE